MRAFYPGKLISAVLFLTFAAVQGARPQAKSATAQQIADIRHRAENFRPKA